MVFRNGRHDWSLGQGGHYSRSLGTMTICLGGPGNARTRRSSD